MRTMRSESGSEANMQGTPNPNGAEKVVTGREGRKKVKLHGRAFYESIGSPKIVLAPMVEQSEFVSVQSFCRFFFLL
jgi:tRNA-dihydrouridine synthase 1